MHLACKQFYLLLTNIGYKVYKFFLQLLQNIIT